MRLLERRDSDLYLTEDLQDHEIPPYAILSHTWGQRRDEVDFRDMVQGIGRAKTGYAKIRFCSEQAARDNLQHFWVDSCCIDRSSSAELSEAITSMFRWYQRAEKCYVYLADVSTTDQYSRWNWEQAFRGSRWFTRGWTLQELLAPRVVEFFSYEGRPLGDKKSLEDLVGDITGIAVGALRGVPLSQFGNNERLSWTRSRYTTREEDEAYCLLGIFEVSMPVIYGEGRGRAIDRLRKEIDEASKGNREKTPQTRALDEAALPLPKSKGDWAALYTLKDHASSIITVVFSPDGKMLASGSWDDEVMLWDGPLGAALHTLEGHKDLIRAVAFSPDSKMLASGSEDCTVRLWDCQLGAALHMLESHEDSVSAVAFSPDYTLASGSKDSTVKLWNGRSGRVMHTLEGHKGNVKAVAFSPDGKMLASGSEDSTVKLWDSQLGAVLHTLEGHKGYINAVDFSPDGKTLASGSDDGTVKLWHSQSGAALHTLGGHHKKPQDGQSGFVEAVAFSPDGRTLASGSYDGAVRLWDGPSGVALYTLEGYKDYVITQTGRSGPALHTLEGDPEYVGTVAFSSDGTLASGSRDNSIRLWDCRSGAALHTLEGHKGSINAISFSPDGKTLASGSEDGTVIVWG